MPKHPLLLAFLASLALCANAQASNTDDPEPDPHGFARYADAPAVSYHAVEVRGETIRYRATAGTMPLASDDGEHKADVFFVAYERVDSAPEGQEGASMPDPRSRPITFSFNGGPGSSSVWLHLGIFGPKRVAYDDDAGNPGPPPYGVIDNAHSLLDRSDFVFIDPVSTGYSRPGEDTDASTFHGVEPDIESVAQFIRMYLTRSKRWESPRFIAGESYGTTRAAGLAQHLHQRYGIALNGVILVSSVLDFATLRFNQGNDLPFALFLPTYAATAHYHKALPESTQRRPLREVIADAERFAAGPYLMALFAGDRLSDDERAAVADRLSDFTGLDPSFLLRSRLRIPMSAFGKELLRDRGITVGRLDSRFTGVDRDDAGDRYEYDASYAAIYANYTGALMDWITRGLGYESDMPYEILTGRVRPWDYGQAGNNRYVNVADRLRGTMERVPSMRVFVASGYYDLATPHFAFEHTLANMGLREESRTRFDLKYYEAGHMMYIHRPSLEALSADLAAFYDNTVPLPRD